jgi:hypothetical protein
MAPGWAKPSWSWLTRARPGGRLWAVGMVKPVTEELAAEYVA